MIYRVIISHGQAEYLGKFPRGVPTVVVFDEYDNAGVSVCEELRYAHVKSPKPGNRGANRNCGLHYLLDGALLAPDDIIEFMDGDRVPTRYSPWSVNSLFNTHKLDGLLYTCEADARLEKIHVPEHGALLIDTGTLCNPFYSCGFAMRFSAISRILSSTQGSLFDPRFAGWGCEDQYLGLMCDNMGMRIAITAEVQLRGKVGGDAALHPGYRESLQQYLDLARANFPIRVESRAPEVLE